MIEAPVETTYEKAYPALHELASACAARIVRNDDDAEELAQEALLRAYGRWSDISGYAAAWVTRVVTNLAINQIRRKHVNSEAPSGVSTEPSDAQLDLTRALDTLPVRQRQVVVLRHIGDLSEEDTAKALGISVGAVKRHLHRATMALQGMPILASGYKRTYAFEQQLAEYEKWIAENVIPAPEPPAGWPPPPWDHCYFLNDDGTAGRWAVDEEHNLILDANGDRVLTGPGFRYVLCKPLPGPSSRMPSVPAIPLESLSEEVRDALDRAFEITMRFGDTCVGDVSMAMALAERFGDPPPLELHHLRRGHALFTDGPHADARLRRFAKREAAGWTRPQLVSALPLGPNFSLVDRLRHAAVQASRRGELATFVDVVEALLRPADQLPHPPPPSAVLSTMRRSRENRIPQPIDKD